MKLLEIKNNLIKLSYEENEVPILGRFIALTNDTKSYVGQFVNLKTDNSNNYAIAKLLFNFTPDGIVDNYDGSVPSLDSNLSILPMKELLDVLPIETPFKIGNIAQSEDVLNLDISVFENNFTVFCERQNDRTTFISNCVRQLFEMKEKTVVIDSNNSFENYSKITFTKDFKLPLNCAMIDYIFEKELSQVDSSTKAVIQDIFYEVEQYIKTLDYEFLPIDKFVDVVTVQYKENQMPELALLKNKLLKYRDLNIFANSLDEVFALNKILDEKNCSIIAINTADESLEKEVISFVHKSVEKLGKYVYLFVTLTDENSDKKLLKQIINNNHVFTTVMVSNSYKYAQELKSYAQNMAIFAPKTPQHEFGAYNTFLNKLNLGECIVYGKLTQGIPFIVNICDLELNLTKDDVFGEKYQFVPIASSDQYELKKIDQDTSSSKIPQINQPPLEIAEEPADVEFSSCPVQQPLSEQNQTVPSYIPQSGVGVQNSNIIAPVNNLLEEPQPSANEQAPAPVQTPAAPVQAPALEQGNVQSQVITPNQEVLPSQEIVQPQAIESFQPLPAAQEQVVQEPNEDDFDEIGQIIESEQDFDTDLTEDDLNFIEDSNMISQEAYDDAELNDINEEPFEQYTDSPYVEEKPPVVPIYTPQEPVNPEFGEETEFMQGDSISHPRYGKGVIEKIIKYGNKTLCSITFENVGRRLLDPTISEFVKL